MFISLAETKRLSVYDIKSSTLSANSRCGNSLSESTWYNESAGMPTNNASYPNLITGL